MSRISLRQLAKQYADGALDRDSYRRARADYIEHVLNGEESPGSLTQANYTSPPAVAGEETVTAAQLKDTKAKQRLAAEDGDSPDFHMQTQPIQLSERSHSAVYISAGAIAALLLAVIGLSLYLGGDSETGTAVAPAGGPQPPAEAAPAQPLASASDNPALEQLETFLASPEWSQQALNEFAREWQALPLDQREAALDSTLARQLRDALYRQLLEERALAGLDADGGSQTDGQQKIVDFADRIGLEDKRLQVAADG